MTTTLTPLREYERQILQMLLTHKATCHGVRSVIQGHEVILERGIFTVDNYLETDAGLEVVVYLYSRQIFQKPIDKGMIERMACKVGIGRELAECTSFSHQR